MGTFDHHCSFISKEQNLTGVDTAPKEAVSAPDQMTVSQHSK